MNNLDGIAIIGMSGRFPGASDIKTFWQNLLGGVNSITFVPDEELNLSPAEVAEMKANPHFVQKSATIKDADHFDAAFFGIYPREAQAMDPQQRLFLECCWEAIEDSGYEPSTYPGAVGVYGGSYMNTYILNSLTDNPAFIGSLADSFHGGVLQNELGNDKDYMTTRVSFKLNLRGPSMTVQTACSTSLVAVAQACMSLNNYQCDMALAGGSTLKLPQNRGYLYQPDGMVSPDGVCRTFDINARGTVFGDGVSVVLLKRLEDAVADGDSIYAVIKGWGVNNDGASKVGYTAPSADGQMEAIALAQAIAEVDPSTISYIEAHGTGTPLGDPIEIDALSRAFRMGGATDKQFCAIGSLKTNIGHLDVAAGVAGLIKTSLALTHEKIPASLNFETPNPNIEFEETPFYVNKALSDWKRGDEPRRAGVSSFGVGGTNAHVVVEEAPLIEHEPSRRSHHLIALSARSAAALEAMTDRLVTHLDESPDLPLEDVAYTLQTGRAFFNYSRTVAASDSREASALLKEKDPQRVFTTRQVRRNRPVVFMFPGQGSQHVNMGLELYKTEPVFQREMDRCAAILEPILGFDLREALYPSPDQLEEAQDRINQTMIAQPGIFAVSYALAQVWMSYGIQPRAMIGHSVGEFVAACLAGIFTLEEGLRLVALRGKLMQDLPAGSMMAVRAPAEELASKLPDDIAIAAVNSVALCVVSGPTGSIEQLQQELEAKEIICRSLHTSHAFHSSMMEPAITPFATAIEEIELKAPQIPICSTVRKTWLTDTEATDPAYWAAHLRETVHFAGAVSELAHESNDVFIEVGPGQTLSTLTRQHPAKTDDHDVLSSMPHVQQEISSYQYALETLGKLWQAGVNVDWQQCYRGEKRKRVHLPTYPFERKRFWYDTAKPETEASTLHNNAPNGAPAAPQTASVNGHHATPAVAPQASFEPADEAQRLVAQQLQLMTQQLQAWQSLQHEQGRQ